MRCTYIGLAAALCWTASGVKLDKVEGLVVGGHRILADVGSHRKNASSVSLNKSTGSQQYGQLELRQAAGRCGQQYGRCPDNQCCSDYGFCGDSVDHCAPLFNCQPQYGVCGWPRAAPPAPTTSAPPPPPTTSAPPPPPTTTSAPPPPPTTTSAPPPPPTTTSAPPPPPTTTSVAPPPPSTVSSAGPTPTGLRVTTNGMCGNGTVCIGSTQWGPCCSQFFWCGSSLDFCGAGCQSQFGACFGVPGQPGLPASNVTSLVPPTTRATTSVPVVSTTIVQLTPTTSAPPPPPTTSAPPPPPSTTTSARPTSSAVQIPPGMRSSTDGKCGTGVTCLGSTFGRCCSQFGYCGDGDQFCPPIVGCQPEFGYCDPGRSF